MNFTKKLWLGLFIVIAVAAVSSGYILYKVQSQPHIRAVRNGPAPMPFDYPVEIKSESVPLHLGEEFTVQPKDKLWTTGNSVKIYYLPENENTTDVLLYKHSLPSGAKQIGTAQIQNGSWSFGWKVPKEAVQKGYGSFLIAVRSNDGIVSGIRVDTLRYNSFEVSPKVAHTGGSASYSGSGFPDGCCVEVELMRITPGIYPGETIAHLGSFHRTNGSFGSSFGLNQKQYGHDITPGQYILEAVIIPKDESREARQAVFANFTVE